jgi:endonuclease G, mitochondrial
MNRRFPWALVVFLTAMMVALAVRWSADRDRAANDRRGVNQPQEPGGQEPEEGRDTWPGGPANASPDSVHLAMGNPSGATPDSADRDNYLMVKPFFALSYNNSNGAPNWVSWCLRDSDLGDAPRSEFYPDPELPHLFKHVTPRDYSGSGFDRGHMCPHGDRSASPEQANATFAMTNIVPQSPACNQKAWADLEDYCREQVKRKHQTAYLIAGPQGVGGEGTKGPADTIADGKVTVPNKVWKVVLLVDGGVGGEADIARVGTDSRLIAVVMPNDQSVGHGWARYRTSAREVERLTGYHFFDRVPAAVIGPLKDEVDRVHIPPERPHRRGD